ncbi:hypothetical protein QBC37DRAFT_379671 [Rhypophila decipiens]|uniref:Uncharacterized protein n=1 Tax=Rhypophila decipiens TaxID=261697 RepID=A0AAN6Y0D2_9PEZI|nr:hypothetical protein QBC37DRAFT_379671 [Rhypophila decipiens]
MKISFALVSVLAGLVMASPVPEAAAPAAVAPAPAVPAPIKPVPGGGEVGTQAFDSNCVSCVSRTCGAAGIRCLNRLNPILIVSCLALTCADDVFKCCVF